MYMLQLACFKNVDISTGLKKNTHTEKEYAVDYYSRKFEETENIFNGSNVFSAWVDITLGYCISK